MNDVVLKVDGLSVDYPLAAFTVSAVKEACFEIRKGERIGLVGESGSGKTTIALALMGMLKEPGRITAGSVAFAGTDLARISNVTHARMRLKHIAYIPQGAMNSLNPVVRIRQSFAYLFRDHDLNLSATEMERRMHALFEQVGLSSTVGEKYPHELSGGMKQRVCIAMGISLGAQLILADEPTSALDVVTQRQIMETLDAARLALGSSMILIGHDMGLMAQSVDRLFVMKDGVIVEQGQIAEIFRNPRDPYTRELISSVPTLDDVLPPAAATAGANSLGQALMEFRGVTKIYPPTRRGDKPSVALYPLNMALSGDKPQIISVVGQSGSGKTTMAALILGFADPTAGQILYRGKPMDSFSRQERTDFRREVQAIFQDPFASFNPFYRVGRSLALPLRNFGLAQNADAARILMLEACASVDLDGEAVLDRFPHQLSGGQRQRLMVARALMLKPRLLIADEPVSMVDASMRASILDSLLVLRRDHGISILYITHDLATAHRVSDIVMVLHKGRLVEAGAPANVLLQPQHPYTRLLVDSIPWPDPTRPWGGIDQREALNTEIARAEAQPCRVAISSAGFSLETAA